MIYMEHKELWGMEGEVAEGEQVSLGKARILQAGSDVTLVSWSRTLQAAQEAAARARQQGVSVELIDLRTLWPWDREAVLASAAKTGRLIVAHEAVRVAGFGAEIAAEVAETLGVRVKRLGGARIPVGYSRPLEDEARLTAAGILQAIMDFK